MNSMEKSMLLDELFALRKGLYGSKSQKLSGKKEGGPLMMRIMVTLMVLSVRHVFAGMK